MCSVWRTDRADEENATRATFLIFFCGWMSGCCRWRSTNRGCIPIEHKMVAVRAVLLLLALAVGKTDSFSPQLPWRLAVVPSATHLSVSLKPSTCDNAVVELRIAMDGSTSLTFNRSTYRRLPMKLQKK